MNKHPDTFHFESMQKANSVLKEENKKLIKLNNKIKNFRTKLENAFFRGKTDELIFEGLYEGGEVTVITLTGRRIIVNVIYTDNVNDLQEKIYQESGVPVSRQRLIFGGRRLKPHRSIYSYKIPVGGEIHLVLDMRPSLEPWCPSDPKEIAVDQYFIDKAVRKLIENRQLVRDYPHLNFNS